MADWARVTLQARGKIRRFVEGKLRTPEETEALLARRKGDCNRCGACCKIVFRCPFLGTDAQGEYTCRIYQYRFTQCRLFPLHAQDLAELGEECSYTFEPEVTTEPVPATD
jgi:Fe-S-cluster containining protein